jgi:hypothetical protein
MRRLHAVATGADPLRDRLATNALKALLPSCDRLNPVRRHRLADRRVLGRWSTSSQRLSQPMTVAGLADAAGISP